MRQEEKNISRFRVIKLVELNRCAVGWRGGHVSSQSLTTPCRARRPRGIIVSLSPYKERRDDPTSSADDRGHAAAEPVAAHGRGVRRGGGPVRPALRPLAGAVGRRAGAPVPAAPGPGAARQLEPVQSG